jgi:serine kinase of HPr protein (carbohydrate metabolism regulator)
MTMSAISSETLHASCVAIRGRAVLISGGSGSGKSDLALRLIDRGAELVSDDYTIVRRVEGRLVASPPQSIAGKLEVRGLGILERAYVQDAPVCLAIDLARGAARMPEPDEALLVAGVRLPVIALNAFEASAPMKAELALERYGLRLA